MVTRQIMYVSLVFLLAACGKAGKEKTDQPIVVKTVAAEKGAEVQWREYPFIAKPFKETDLSFRIGGPIDRFEVYAGNSYKKGEIIAGIDSRDFKIRKEKAEAVFNQAKAEFARIKVLYEKNNISASTYEKAHADYTSAKTSYEAAVNELNDTQLIAPFDGYVGEVYIEKYQDVKATQPVVSFINIDQLKIEAYVPQDVAFGWRDLKEVDLCFDAQPDTTYCAKVEEISKGTTRNNLSYLLTALLPNKDMKLLAGMSGKIRLNKNIGTLTPVATIIPQTALCHRPTEGDYVWVVDKQSHKVSHRKVRLGGLLPNGRVAVADGLQADEIIAVSNLRFLSDGMIVKTSNGKK